MAEAISEGNDRNLWKVHSLKKSCHFIPNVIDGHIGSEILLIYFPQSLSNCTIMLDLMKTTCTY